MFVTACLVRVITCANAVALSKGFSAFFVSLLFHKHERRQIFLLVIEFDLLI
jgi:Na+-transporting NADH:ubiquinone oxidoreductase subunit NqrD